MNLTLRPNSLYSFKNQFEITTPHYRIKIILYSYQICTIIVAWETSLFLLKQRKSAWIAAPLLILSFSKE